MVSKLGRWTWVSLGVPSVWFWTTTGVSLEDNFCFCMSASRCLIVNKRGWQTKIHGSSCLTLCPNIRPCTTTKQSLVNNYCSYRGLRWSCVIFCSVNWGCRIHRLHLCRGVRLPTNECSGYDTKESDAEVPVMLGLWGMQSNPSLPLLPGPLWPGEVAPDKALSMG